MVRAKFKVERIETGADGPNIVLQPVVGGSAENDAFFKLTPSGVIQMNVLNEAAAAQFQVGGEYYVDFTPASQPN